MQIASDDFIPENKIRARTVSLGAYVIFLCILISSTSAADEVPDSVYVLPAFTVTASRGTDDRHTPLVVRRITADDIRLAGVPAADDLLRRIPGFSLFRRTSSLVANPTTQGASLRGIGPSGTSRALVLYDGIPLNDPFGGWIGWSQIDTSALEAIDVVRGGGSSAWGNAALGGVIQFLPSRSESGALQMDTGFGTYGTARFSARAAASARGFHFGLNGHAFSTDGYNRVRADQRGSVDIPTRARHRAAELSIDHTSPSGLLLGGRMNLFREKRGNGTPLANNSTESFRFHLKSLFLARDEVDWRADLYAGQTTYRSTFTSVNSARITEQIVLDQFAVPSQFFGIGIRRTSPMGQDHLLTLGAEYRQVRGETREFVVFQQGNRLAGGSQNFAAAYAEHVWTPMPNLAISTGLRSDFWSLQDGFLEVPGGIRLSYPDRTGNVFQGRVGAILSLSSQYRLRLAAYEGFRMPTLNELYRPFQVGADVTQANASLDPERLQGFEAGLDGTFAAGVRWQMTVFHNEVMDPVLNVTIGTTGGGGQLRQRRNIERTRIRGWELDTTIPLNDGWDVSFALAWTEANVRLAGDQPELTGRRLAQVPRWVATSRLSYTTANDRLRGEIRTRWTGAQYEDDLNTRRLHGYLLTDFSGVLQVSERADLFLSLENLFDRRYPDGITGQNLVTEGAGRTAFGGVKLRF